MTRSPLVSVLVTVYNRERYLAGCLDSILASTWQDYEVILVDDGSTDGSMAIAEAYALRDGRIRCFRNDRNLGDYPNRMRAAALARGVYLKYVDSDDLIYPHSLAIMVEGMEAHPEAALGLCHSLPEDEAPYPWLLQPEEAWRKHFLGRGCLGTGPSGAILRREAFSEVGGFRDWGVLNDSDLWLRMSSRWPIVLFPPGLVWWRRHEGQEFTRGNAAEVYLSRGFVLQSEALEERNCPLPMEERQRARGRIRQHHARRLWSLALRQRSLPGAWRLFKASGLGLGEVLSGLGRYR